MNWDYFIEGDTFRAKRLPMIKSSVSIKDTSNLTHLIEDLAFCHTTQECIDTYRHLFSSIFNYEVEVTDFDDYITNPNHHLYKTYKNLVHNELLEFLTTAWEDNEFNTTEWTLLDNRLAIKLEEYGLIKIKEELTARRVQ